MALLKYVQDGVPIEVTLDSDDITVGRTNACVIKIVGDPEISRLHCALHRRGPDAFVVLDTSSRNGTFVNGQRLGTAEVELQDGDQIRIGRTRFNFYLKAPSVPVSPDEMFAEVARQMEEGGKGFGTMLHEIVDEAPHGRRPRSSS